MQASTRRAGDSATSTGREPGGSADVHTELGGDQSEPVGSSRGDGPLRVELGANLAATGFTLGVCLATALAFSLLLHVLG